MESNEELKEVNINSRTFYCFGDRIKTEDFDFNNKIIQKYFGLHFVQSFV